MKLKIFLSLFFLLLIINSCKKNQELSITEAIPAKHMLEDKFFEVPANSSQVIETIISAIKLENKRTGVVAKIITELGMPFWEKSLIRLPVNKVQGRQTNGNSDTSYVLVPIVPVGTKEVDALFACKVFNDSVIVKLVKEKNYRDYGFSNDAEYSGNHLVSIMMFLQYHAFGATRFVLHDGRLFSGNSNADSTKKRVVKISVDTTNNSIGGKVLSVVSTFCIDYNNVNCGGDPFYNGTCTMSTCFSSTGNIISTTIYYGNQYIVGGQGSSGSSGSTGGIGSGGGGGEGSSSLQILLQQMLALTPAQENFLWQYPQMAEEVWTYVHNSDGAFNTIERKLNAIQQIQFLLSDNNYLNFCLDQYNLHYSWWGWSTFWFNQLCIEGTEPVLYGNIQNLKLGPKQAYYLLNNPEINLDTKQFSEEEEYSNAVLFAVRTTIDQQISNRINGPYDDMHLSILQNNLNKINCCPTGPILGTTLLSQLSNRMAFIKSENPSWGMWKCYRAAMWEIGHVAFDILGTIPVGGEVFDVANGVIYLV